jgi:uncharacterized protein (DUF302 family)
MTAASTDYAATRLTYDSAASYAETRARFDERVPLLNPSVSFELVLAGAPWADVEAAVNRTVGPTGLVALTRLDSGALFSLSGTPFDATLYLVGNPLIARGLTAIAPAGVLYAPFRVAAYEDSAGVHVAYDQPSTVFRSLGSPEVDDIAAELDKKIQVVVEEACR